MTHSGSLSRRQMFGVATGAALGLQHALPTMAQAATLVSQLPIPSRLQWEELDGYCGECSIQQAALYFGTYVSQYACRGIINTNQLSQLLVAVNAQKVLTALRLTSTEFDYNRTASPQFLPWFGWVKQHLYLKHPVMIVAYVRGLSDPDYDHIMLATGFTSTDSTTYHATDLLCFNDCFDPLVKTRVASTLNDNRKMRVNGAKYPFCIPTTTCYGCAITGIQDTSLAALPVQVILNTWSEPDIIAGAKPVTLNATVSISGLTIGKSYSLYRYNDYRTVPTANYAKSAYSSVVQFVANSTALTYPVLIPSNSVAVFRCLPAGK